MCQQRMQTNNATDHGRYVCGGHVPYPESIQRVSLSLLKTTEAQLVYTEVMSVVHSGAPITVFTELQDYILNQGAQYIGPWDIEVKLYRANQSSWGPEGKDKILFMISVSHQPGKTYMFGPETGIIAEPPMKQMVDSKLQSLWLLRQTFKGDGHAYKSEGGGILRISNIHVQGTYKGLLIDVDFNGDAGCRELANNILKEFNIEQSFDSEAKTEIEKVRQYEKVYR